MKFEIGSSILLLLLICIILRAVFPPAACCLMLLLLLLVVVVYTLSIILYFIYHHLNFILIQVAPGATCNRILEILPQGRPSSSKLNEKNCGEYLHLFIAMDTTPSPDRPVLTPPPQRPMQINLVGCQHGKNPSDPFGSRLRTVPRGEIEEIN